MWRRTLNSSVLRDIQSWSRRHYLTESYKLNQEWAMRLETPILQKVSIENLYFEIDNKFSQQKKISAVDVDIYANKITDNQHMDEISDLVQKLRTTEEATNLFDSTQHALIRNYIENNNLDALVHILSHRMEYGIFLDHHTANILLDKLIQDKDFKLGARFAAIHAFQEDFSNEITSWMSLYTCYKFLGNLDTFDDLVVVAPVEETGTKKKKDEVRVRVSYLRNPHFDDHFDVKNTNHLIGKTLLYLADEVQEKDETLANSLRVLGFGLYEKFEDGRKFLASSKSSAFYKEAILLAQGLTEKIENLDANEAAKEFFADISSLTLKEENVEQLIENTMKQVLKEHEAKDIQEQKKIYEKWITERDQKVNVEIARMERIQRLLNIEKVQEDLDAEERKLWFFENEEKIDLDIESKKTFYPKKWFGKRKKPRVMDENYVPPDVDKRRNV